MLTALVAVGTLAVLVVAAVVVVDVVRGQARADQTTLGPVLVVPGYGGRVESLEPLVDALRAAGRDVEIVAPIGDGTGDLEAEARRLGEVAEQAMERTDATSVDVVGYSAGGVVARLWVADDGATVARRVVTIGSPHHGTDVAQLAVDVAGSCPTACRQLVPDSDLLRVLNARDETPDGPAWVTLQSDSDEVVTPSESASLDGALDLVVQEFCPDATTSHGALPGDPVVLAALESTLGPADPRVPMGVDCD